MDGNGRWAASRHRPRVFGHIRGCARIKSVVKEADKLGVRALTLYAFSTENWNRPETEVSVLWKLLKKYLLKEKNELKRMNVRLRVIGEVERLGKDVREILDPALKELSSNTGLNLTFAISYGARRELVRAARMFAEDCVAGRKQPGELTDESMRDYLWTSFLGPLSDVDLVIRTSGEMRISNFLLWQSAYSEFVFTDVFWPDFGPEHLRAALDDYARRERRFGGVCNPKQLVNGISP
jgi:undecaprenyl diphosphate synthase